MRLVKLASSEKCSSRARARARHTEPRAESIHGTFGEKRGLMHYPERQGRQGKGREGNGNGETTTFPQDAALIPRAPGGGSRAAPSRGGFLAPSLTCYLQPPRRYATQRRSELRRGGVKIGADAPRGVNICPFPNTYRAAAPPLINNCRRRRRRHRAESNCRD